MVRIKKKILVLCVDRDDDIGNKTHFKGPIIGREKNIALAMALGISDPADADTNAIFEAVKVHDELSKASDVEVATITGHKEEGMKADREIIKQLGETMKKFKPDGIVFVSDGANDEYVMPLLSSKAGIISVRRVVIRQSERYEGFYFAIQNFIKHSLENPRLARVVFGLPAIALILFSIFDVVAWRFILGVVGAFLLIKGFGLEGLVGSLLKELKFSLKARKTTFFLYIAASAIGMIAISRGYEAVSLSGPEVWYKALGTFAYNTVYIFFLSEIMLVIGWLISHPTQYRQAVNLIILGFSLNFLVYSASEVLIMPDKGLLTFLLSLVLGFLVIVTTFALESKVKSK
ncbi:MAG: DUF373 family protein, partial [Candidatus Aenigmarchaeota archaeon]|nr:DUF373 family protein [Candidatus Aenigmarchaeota archaeon]